MEKAGPYKKLNTILVLLVSVVVVMTGGVLLLLSEWLEFFSKHPAWKATVGQAGGAILTTGLLSLLWDLAGKRAMAKEIFAAARIAADIQEAGVERIAFRYLTEVEWSKLFESARELDVFVAYGRSWRNINHENLLKIAKKRGAVIRVVLPDPEDDQHLSVLATRFGHTGMSGLEKVKGDILDTAKSFASMLQIDGAAIKIYYRKGDLLFSCYRFDQRLVLALYSHKRERTNVPTFVVSNGALYDFAFNDLEAIVKQSREVDVGSIMSTGTAKVEVSK